MTPSTRLLVAADRLANRPCSDTERATANLLKLISDRLHERGFYPEPELKLALALADAVESEHGMPETPRSLAADNHVVELLALAIRRRERTPEAIAADEAERGYHNAIIGYREMVRDMLRGIDKAVAEAPAAIARRDERFRSGEYVVPDWFAEREAPATQPLPDRAEADLYRPDLTAVELAPPALIGEVTSPYGLCSATEDPRDSTCTNFAAEYVAFDSAIAGLTADGIFSPATTLRRMCTPCADATPNVISRRPLTTAPGGYPVAKATIPAQGDGRAE